MNNFENQLHTQQKFPLFQEPFELLTFKPHIVYPQSQYTSYEGNNSAILNNILNSFPGSTPLFTDGSKSNSGVGCAMYCPNYNVKIKIQLHRLCSIYTAEAFAIWKALDWVLRTSIGSVVILTDSKSVLETLNSHILKNFNNKLIIDILKLCYLLTVSGCSASFVWVKGHSGIAGNEVVDSLAKEAAKNGENWQFVTTSDINTQFSHMAMNAWKYDWSDFASRFNN